MDCAIYEEKELRIQDFLKQNSHIGEEKAVEKLKRFGNKGALFCRFCQGNLILKAGQQREIHFAHKGKSCLASNAYDSYIKQMKRENQKWSVMKEFIYNELKGQEKIKNVNVDYGYVAKAEEQWKQLPDIIVQTPDKEIAVNVITNVHEIGDKPTVRQFIKRDRYLKEKGLEVIWFVEDRELADDMDNRVIHLWEIEYNLAMKTEQDEVWDAFLHQFDDDKIPFYKHLGYRARKNLDIDCRSLYYVHHSTDDQILFSIYRIILDEKASPYRCFAVNEGYQIELTSALSIKDTVLLSDPEKDDQERNEFKQLLEEKKKNYSDLERDNQGSSAFLQNEFKQMFEEKKKQYTYREREVVYYPEDESQRVGQTYAESINHHNIDPVELLKKIKYFSITAKEAKQLYQFIMSNKYSLEDYGLTFQMIQAEVTRSLGFIEDTKIREPLVDIMYLSSI